MKTLILTLAATIAFAQNPPSPAPSPLAPGETIRVVEVKQGDAYSIWNNLRQIFPGISQTNGRLIIRGQTAVVDMMEDAIKKLDVPSPEMRAVNVELTFQLLYGSAQEGANAVPADLESTVRQLRATFPYKSYRVLDTQVLRARDGKDTSSEGNLPGGSSTYALYFGARPVPGPAPRTVNLQNLRLIVRLSDKPGGSQISTSLDAKEGQKTVVGKSNVIGTDDAIFLVVTPKVIE